MTGVEVLCALAIVVGLVSIVLLVVPGVLIIAAAMLVWAYDTGGATAWTLAGGALAVLLVGFVVKFTVPHRRLKEAGVPNSTMLFAAALGIAGFFVVPVVGLFVGFVGGVWLAEARRVGRRQAWPSTRSALLATGISLLIELGSGLLATAAFIAGVVLT